MGSACHQTHRQTGFHDQEDQKMVISVSFQKSIAFDWKNFGVEVREIGLAQREQLAQNLFSQLFLCYQLNSHRCFPL